MNINKKEHYTTIIILILIGLFCPFLVFHIYGGDVTELVGHTDKLRTQFLWELGLALSCAFITNALMHRALLACLVASVSFSLLLQIGLSAASGIDPFFPIALLIMLLVGTSVTAPISLVFHLVRYWRNKWVSRFAQG